MSDAPSWGALLALEPLLDLALDDALFAVLVFFLYPAIGDEALDIGMQHHLRR